MKCCATIRALLLGMLCFPTATAQTTSHEPLWEKSDPFWGAYTSSEFRGGNRRVLSDAIGFLPLFQDGQSLLFADIRGQFDDRGSREANWGLGLRSIVAEELIVGGYGYYDRRWSSTDNTFNQLTIGGELKSYLWDLRVNGYLAEQSTQLVGPGLGPDPLNPRAIFADNTILLVSGGPGSQPLERAYSGADFEIGALLKAWGNNDAIELRSFFGGYYFGTNAEEFPTVMGPRARLELRGFDLPWMGDGSRLTIGAEYAWDQVRESQYTGIARVQVPVNFFRRRRLNPFHRRMLDRVQRDVDIITHTAFAPERVENTRYAETGLPVGRVSLADANHDLSRVVLDAGPDSTVIVDGSRGTLHTNSTTFLHSGQTVRGAGFEVRGLETGALATFGTRPLIASGNQAIDTFVVADGITIRDLDIFGGRAGISSDPTGGMLLIGSFNNFNNGRIFGNRVSGAEEGFLFGELNSGSLLEDNLAEGNHHNGFTVAILRGGSVLNNTATASGNDGFHIDLVTDGARIEDNLAFANRDEGFELHRLRNSSFSNNRAIENEDKGIQVNDIIENDSVVSGNTASRNGDSGFKFEEVDDSGILGNTASHNGDDGFRIAELLGGRFAGNSSDNNLGHGVHVMKKFSRSTFSGNTADGNGGHGFLLPDLGDSEVSENAARGNALSGFSFRDLNAIFTDNLAEHNGENGFSFTTVERFGWFSSNQANRNGFDPAGELLNPDSNGFYFQYNSGLFTNNSAEGNANNGFAGTVESDLPDDNFSQIAGEFSGNAATNNGDQGYRGINGGGNVNGNTGSGNGSGGDTFP